MSTTTARAPADARLLVRGDTVLWTLAGDGIVLHNFATRRFLALDAAGYRTWGFLDGAHSVDEVVASVCGPRAGRAERRRVRELVELLAAHGFVDEVAPDA